MLSDLHNYELNICFVYKPHIHVCFVTATQNGVTHTLSQSCSLLINNCVLLPTWSSTQVEDRRWVPHKIIKVLLLQWYLNGNSTLCLLEGKKKKTLKPKKNGNLLRYPGIGKVRVPVYGTHRVGAAAPCRSKMVSREHTTGLCSSLSTRMENDAHAFPRLCSRSSPATLINLLN